MIGRFCGKMDKLPKGGIIVSTHNQLYLWFRFDKNKFISSSFTVLLNSHNRSDNSTAQDGFELTWESVDPRESPCSFTLCNKRFNFEIPIRMWRRFEHNNARNHFKPGFAWPLSNKSRLRMVHNGTTKQAHSVFVLHSQH